MRIENSGKMYFFNWETCSSPHSKINCIEWITIIATGLSQVMGEGENINELETGGAPFNLHKSREQFDAVGHQTKTSYGMS